MRLIDEVLSFYLQDFITFSVFLSLSLLIMLSKCYITTSFSLRMNWELLLLFKLFSCSGVGSSS